MDPPTTATTPPSRRSDARLRSKHINCISQSLEDSGGNHDCPHSLKNNRSSPISPSPLHLTYDHIPLQELLLLSQSPVRRSKSRTVVHGENAERAPTPCRKTKNRGAPANVDAMGCPSPRNARRARRRLEKENVAEEGELGLYDKDAGKVRKRRRSRNAVSRKEKLSLVSPAPSSSLSTKVSDDGNQDGLSGVWEMVSELIMWKDVAKSSLWFGFGSLCFFSSCFSSDYGFSIISAVSHLGLFMLALSFFYDSYSERYGEKRKREFKLKEEDILCVSRVLLPTTNAAILIAQNIFSGEPSMTLKVAPVLLFAAKYGHLISLWRLSATGFFVSFTAPKLYSCYSIQIQRQVENIKKCTLEAWKACRHKRFLAASATMMFWNLFSVKTRIFAAFIAVVMLRYHREKHSGKQEHVEDMEGVQQQTLAVAEKECQNTDINEATISGKKSS